MRKFAHVGIEPSGTLAETAALLGRVLGGLVFVEDTRRLFDEFPAYVAKDAGVRYALLGIPAPEDDVREVRTDDFELLVEPLSSHGDGEKKDISAELLSKIERDGRLRCWSLK